MNASNIQQAHVEMCSPPRSGPRHLYSERGLGGSCTNCIDIFRPLSFKEPSLGDRGGWLLTPYVLVVIARYLFLVTCMLVWCLEVCGSPDFARVTPKVAPTLFRCCRHLNFVFVPTQNGNDWDLGEIVWPVCFPEFSASFDAWERVFTLLSVNRARVLRIRHTFKYINAR